MANHGWAAEIVFPEREGEAQNNLASLGLTVIKLGIRKPVHMKKLFQFLLYLISLPHAFFVTLTYLRKSRPDVVHVNGAFDFIPAFCARILGIPLVWNLNDTIFGETLSRLLGKIVVSTATIVAIASKQVGEHYRISPHKRVVLYEPVDIELFRSRSLNKIPSSPYTLIQVANWNWVKGQDRTVAVASLLAESGFPVRVRFVGKVLESQRSFWAPIFDRMKHVNGMASFDVVGFCEDVSEELASADVALLCSRSEACPLCVLEAMAVGVPQVVFDVGGVTELLGSGPAAAGIVVPRNDVAAMAEAVQELIRDREKYRQFARHAVARARTYFSLEACVEKHLEVYDQAAKSQTLIQDGRAATTASNG